MQIKFLEQDPADGEFSAGWGLEKTRIVIPSLFILKKKWHLECWQVPDVRVHKNQGRDGENAGSQVP